MIIHLLQPAFEALVQIRAGAEDPAVARHDDALDAVVDVEEGERALQLRHHRVRERIVPARPMQR